MKIFIVLSALLAVCLAVECPGDRVLNEHCSCDYTYSYTYHKYELILKCFQLVHEEFEEVMDAIRNVSVYSLKIIKAHIRVLTPENFANTEIRELLITSTIIEKIEVGAFGAIKDLRALYLIRTGLK